MSAPATSAVTSGLSVQQWCILGALYQRHEEIALDEEYPWRAHYMAWGVRWHGLYGQGTRSEQASLSRTLARLESRGLILRQNWASGSPDTDGLRTSKTEAHIRMSNVLILTAGVDLGQRLTNYTGVKC